MISILRRPTSDFCDSVLVLGPMSSAVCRRSSAVLVAGATHQWMRIRVRLVAGFWRSAVIYYVPSSPDVRRRPALGFSLGIGEFPALL